MLSLYFTFNSLYYKNQFETKKNDKILFLINLDKYYTNNIFFVYFMTIFFFIFNTLIFILFRIQFLGISNIIDFSVNSLTIWHILNIILFILNITLYLKILNIIFYSYVIKLHFYLYQKNWYVAFNDFIRDHDMKLASLFRAYSRYCNDILEHNTFIKKYNSINYIFKRLRDQFFIISLYISRFLYYLPYLLVFIIVIYDLYHGCMYYTYYMLFVFLITNIIKKIRWFIYVKDVVYDTQISDYFYKNNDQYLTLRKNIKEKSDIFTLKFYKHFEELNNILKSQEEIIEYFKDDFQVYYVLDKERQERNAILFSRAKRLHILLILIVGNFFAL